MTRSHVSPSPTATPPPATTDGAHQAIVLLRPGFTVAPIVIGILIAAAVMVSNGLRERRIDARLAPLEATGPEGPISAADGPPKEESSDLTHRRIAS